MGNAEYWWWDMKARLRHLFGVHTLIQSEVWTKKGTEWDVKMNGWVCWCCEHREP